MMSHLIKIYAVCNFSYFRLWYLKTSLCEEKYVLIHIVNTKSFVTYTKDIN